MLMRRVAVGIAVALAMTLAAVVFPVATYAAGAPEVDEVSLELADTSAPGHVLVRAGDRFKEMVEERSDGEIEVVRYSHGELYDARGLIEAVEIGSVAMGIQHMAFVGGHSPALEFISAVGAQGLWEDVDHYHRFIDQPEVREIAAEEFESKLNQKLLAMWDYGAGIYAARSEEYFVRDLDGYAGARMRTAGTAMAELYRNLGVSPADLDIGEVYMALERGTIDSFSTGPSRVYLDGMYEVAPYITQDGTLPRLVFWVTMNLDTWNELTPEHQEIIQETATELESFTREEATSDIDDFHASLEEVAEVYYFTDEQIAEVRSVAEPALKALFTDRVGEEMATRLFDLMEQAR